MSNNATKNTSVNSVKISGNICKDAAVSGKKNFAAFDLAHNAGKSGETLFDRIKMFDANGKQAVNIPFDLLKKGKRVLVEGYRVSMKETFTDKQGVQQTKKRDYIIALSVVDYPWMEDGSNPSVNVVEVSGNLYADANKSTNNNFAGFDLAHNAGRNREPLSDKVKMFAPKEGENNIPFDILSKGQRVLVTGYRRAQTETYTARDGSEKKVTKTILVAKTCVGYPWNSQEEEAPAPAEAVVLPAVEDMPL